MWKFCDLDLGRVDLSFYSDHGVQINSAGQFSDHSDQCAVVTELASYVQLSWVKRCDHGLILPFRLSHVLAMKKIANMNMMQNESTDKLLQSLAEWCAALNPESQHPLVTTAMLDHKRTTRRLQCAYIATRHSSSTHTSHLKLLPITKVAIVTRIQHHVRSPLLTQLWLMQPNFLQSIQGVSQRGW